MGCSEKIKQLSRQIENNEKIINRHLVEGIDLDKYEFKKLVKIDINNRIERYILQQLEENEFTGWRDINSPGDVMSKLRNMTNSIQFKGEYETRIVGEDYIKLNATNWLYTKQFLPLELLNKLEPIA